MRRVVMALLATLIGTTLLIGLKSPPLAGRTGYAAEAPLDPAATTGTPGSGDPGGSVQPGQTRPPGTTPDPKATRTAGPKPTGGGPAPTTTKKPPPGTKTTPAPPASRTIVGTAYPAKNFGSMQVKIVVTGTHIDDIVTVQESNRAKSVATTLRTQALSAQSANVGNVSGATYSSDAWKQSLQSAISQI